MPRGTGIMYIIFSRCIGCTLEPSVLRGHIAPTEPVEHSCTCYIIQEHITHIHTKQPRTDARAHIYAAVHAQHKKKKKKDRVQRIRSKRLCAMRKKEEEKKRKKKRNSFLDRCVPTGRKIRRHFTEV